MKRLGFVLLGILGIGALVSMGAGRYSATQHGRQNVYVVAASDAPGKFKRGADFHATITDSDVAIQAACTKAGLDGGGIVELTIGAYSIDTLINIPSNVTVRGSGYDTVLTVANGADVGVFRSTATANVVVENLRLEGNKANQGAIACRGVWFSVVSPGRVSGVWANDFQGGGSSSTRGIGIFIDNSSYVVVENCYADANNYDNIGVRNASANCIVTNCVCTNAAGRAGIQVVNSTDITVAHNVCTGGANGGISVHGGVEISLIGNLCNNNTGQGIHLISPSEADETSDVTVSGNSCHDNSGNGILLERYDAAVIQRITISGNVVNGNAASGIYIEEGGENIIINGNSCYDNGTEEIRISGVDIVVSNNYCVGTVTNGYGSIKVQGDRVLVSGNYCESTAGKTDRGIYCASTASYVTVVGNMTRGHDTCGLGTHASATDILIVGNQFLDSTPVVHAGSGVQSDIHSDLVMTDATASIFFGDPTTNNTWKTVRSGTKLSFQRRESGAYVEKGFFDTASFHSDSIYIGNIELTDSGGKLQANGEDLQGEDGGGESFWQTTGWLEGGQITINADDTKIDITAGSVLVVTGTDNPVGKILSWTAQTALDPALATRSTWVGVKESITPGVAEFVFDTEFDAIERRTTAILGRIWNNAGTQPVITSVGDYERPAWGLLTAFQDFILEYGSWNISGNVYSANGANLLLDKSTGRSYRYHAEDVIGQENVHADAAQSPRNPYAYHLQGVGTTATEIDIDPDNYDNAGVKTALANNRWTIQEVWYFPVSGTCHILYGQAIYSSQAEAIVAISTEAKVRNTGILSGAILRAYLILEKGCTDLTNSANAEIREAGGAGGAGGGGSILWTKTGTDLSPTAAGDDVSLPSGSTLSIADMTSGSILFTGAGGLLSQDNSDFFWDDANRHLGIGTSEPEADVHIRANTPGTVGSHPAGQLIIQDPDNSVFGNVAITGYESDDDGKPDQQLWYLGSESGSNTHITFLNRRNADLKLGTNNSTRVTIAAGGDVTLVGDLAVDGNDIDMGDAGGFSGIKFNPTDTTLEFWIDGAAVSRVNAGGDYEDLTP